MACAILHSDLNSFYASVEMMLDPSLRGKAVAVCGSTEDRHGIVLAKSELAKKAGVKTGMVNWEARQVCRDLIVLPPQYDQYLKYSQLTRAVYRRFTDMIEPFGMDECWLDVSGSTGICGCPMKIAEDIRKTTREELGLTVSIGVSYNKIFAKLGSDMKKPDAITEITKENFKDKVWPLPATDLLYIGRATGKKLANIGIRTIGSVAKLPEDILRRMFGVNGSVLWNFANGTDYSRVMHSDFVSPVKSIGHGTTCNADLNNNEEVWKVMQELSQDVGHRLRVHELSARTVQISIREKDLQFSQCQCKLPMITQLPSDIAKTAYDLFVSRYKWNAPVRSVTVRATDLVPKGTSEQLNLFYDYSKAEAREKLQDAVEDIRRRFGSSAVSYAVLMGDTKMSGLSSQEITMPGVMYR
jgi:DNA polymerase-4